VNAYVGELFGRGKCPGDYDRGKEMSKEEYPTLNAIGMPSISAAVAPVFTRPDSMRSSRQVSLVVGDSARLRCEARGSPTPEVVWYKDDAILTDTTVQPVTWSLELDHVTVEEGGVYTCLVYNHVGSISFSYDVAVASTHVNFSLFCNFCNFYAHAAKHYVFTLCVSLSIHACLFLRNVK